MIFQVCASFLVFHSADGFQLKKTLKQRALAILDSKQYFTSRLILEATVCRSFKAVKAQRKLYIANNTNVSFVKSFAEISKQEISANTH